MEVCSPCSPKKNALSKNKRSSRPSESLDPRWVPNCSPSFFDGSASMVNFGRVTNTENIEGKVDDDFDQRTEKKRRLRADQVQLLEKCFEVENKLEPDRKLQLAEEVGLQPKQVAIWFQNRRARSKSKLVEKEYDSLKAKYDKLKADYDTIRAENNELKNEVHSLSSLSEKLGPGEAGIDFQPTMRFLSSSNTSNILPAVLEKHDEVACSTKSDVSDSHSAHCTGDRQSAFVEIADTSDESLSTSFLQPLCYPNFEGDCGDDLQPNSCNLGFPVQDQGTWVWRY